MAIFFPSPSPQNSVAIHLSQFSSSLFFRNQLLPLKQSSISNGNLHILLFKLLFQTLNKLPQVVEFVMTLNSGGLSWNLLNLNSLLTLSFVHYSLHFCRISTIAHSRGTDAFILPQQDLGNLRVKWEWGWTCKQGQLKRVGSWKSSKYLDLTEYFSCKNNLFRERKKES